MIDEDLFIRGHIDVELDDQIDDFDCLIPEHYFMKVLGLSGEVVDSNGSDYEVISLVDDVFLIEFTVDENEFETDDGKIVGFEELVVRCTGTITQRINGIGDPSDVLTIDNYTVVRVVK